MQTLAITGVGGFIGKRLAERALERGFTVRGLEVSAEAAARAEGLGVQVVVGDITDPAAAARMCEGADAVVHTAAIVREDGPWDLFRRVNVEGAETVARAARDAGVRRFVHLSSVMVYGFHYPPGVDEEGPLRGDGNPYCTTKIESEAALLAFQQNGDLDVVLVRPGDVYGPGSQPWVVRPIELMKARLIVLPRRGHGYMNPVYVDNLIDGLFLALATEHTGQAFNITDGRAVTYMDYFSRLARAAGVPGPWTAPEPLLRAAFQAVERGAVLLGKTPLAHAQALNYLIRPGSYSIEKARQRLGYEPAVSFEEGMRLTEAWIQQEDLP
ncbi:MAG: NAD-dependent epimerase/dehydratase family protein [Myxococcota bacterium]